MNTTKIGQQAEQKVANYLTLHGYKILDKNWKTKTCEIDIVARKSDYVYFVEVKYRSTPNQGTGFEYITGNKLRQMTYAARMWVANNWWYGGYVLSGASVTGPNYDVEFIEQL